MKKRNIMLVTSMLLAILLIAGGTLAWFTDTATPVTNEFTAGTVEIELVDIMYGLDGEPLLDEEENPITSVTNVNPGDCYEKKVYVKNTGSKRILVRIKESTFIYNYNELDLDVGDPNIAIVKFDVNENWVYNPTDRYFYYKHVLYPEGTTGQISQTEPILVDNKICFDGGLMGNEYQGAKFDIQLNAEAIQATNGAPTTAGWMFDPLTPPAPIVPGGDS